MQDYDNSTYDKPMTEKEVGVIQDLNDRLHKALVVQQEAVARLGATIDPVLRPSTPTIDKGNDSGGVLNAEAGRSWLNGEFHSLIRQAEDNTWRINDFLDRLDL